MRRTLLTAAAVVAALTCGIQAQSEAAGDHVTICHRTGSASNPYVLISPDAEGVVSGHLDHEQTGNGPGGDIIPVFIFHGVTYSKNLGITIGGVTGAAILANGCNMPGVTPTPTPIPEGTPPPPSPVPEPMTILLFGTGLASVGFAARKKLFGK